MPAGFGMSTFFIKWKWTVRAHLLAGVLAGGVAVVSGLAVFGFPNFLTRWILAEANNGDYFIQAKDIYLDLRGGLNARNVQVYRKGISGPPFLETRELRILYHLLERPRSGRSRIKELKAYNGILRPLWGSKGLGSKRSAGLSGGFEIGKYENGALTQVDLDVALFNFDVLGVWVEQVKTAVRVDADGVYLSRISGKIGRELHSGTIDGTLAWRHEGKLAGRMATSFDPHAFMPLCKVFYPKAVEELDRYSFPTTPPRLDFTFEVDSKPALSVSAKGRIQASNYAYRGAVIGFASMNMEYVLSNGTNRMRIDPFSLMMGGRHVMGQVDFDFVEGVADFQASSEVNLAAVLRLVGLKESLLEPWVFEEGTHLVAKGRVGYSHPENSEVEARVEGTKFGYKGVSFSSYSFDYKGHGFTHSISDFRGNSGGGSISGSAVLRADQTGVHWTTDVRAEIINADTDEFLKLASTNLGWRMGGKIFGNLDVSGIGAELAGQGQLTIREAQIFKSPVAVGLLEKWGAWTRSLELADLPVEARFSFELNHNKITSRDVVVEAGVFGLAAKGSCGLDGVLDWIITPTLMKNNNALGRVASPLFPPLRPGGYALTGTIEKPEWHPISNQQKD